MVYIWDTTSKSNNLRGMIRNPLKSGISHLAFSPKGDKLAVCCADSQHSIYVFDVSKIISQKGEKLQSGVLLASGVGPKHPVFQMSFEASNTMIGLATKRGVFMGVADRGAIIFKKADMGSYKKEAVLCITYIDVNFVAGSYSGKLLHFRENKLSNEYTGHKGPVMAICRRQEARGLITGGNHGKILFWDGSFSIV